MHRLLHSAAVQLAAVLVAVGLSGAAPLLEAPHAEATHRCQCPKGAGHHDCDCPLCQAEAVRAASQAGAKVPPCHLALARKVRAAKSEGDARRAASGPVLASTCGSGDHRFDPPPVVPLSTVPEAPVVAVHADAARLDDRLGEPLGVPVEPETPPPRLG